MTSHILIKIHPKMIPHLFIFLNLLHVALADTYEIQQKTLYYYPNDNKINETAFKNAASVGLSMEIDRFVLPKRDYESFPHYTQYCGASINKKGFLLDFSYSFIKNFKSNLMIDTCVGGGIANLIMEEDITDLPSSQGTIVELEANATYSRILIKTHNGYRDVATASLGASGMIYGNYQYVMDPITLKPKFNSFLVGQKNANLNRTGFIELISNTDHMMKYNTSVGDYVAAASPRTGPGGGGIMLKRSKMCRVENVTSIGKSFLLKESSGYGNNTFINFVSKRFDRPPPGGDVVPLIVGAGFWSQNMRYGALVKNCHFEYTIDEGFNTHTNFVPVARALPNENIVTLAIEKTLLDDRGDGVKIGDLIYLYDEKFNLVGTPKILEIRSTSYRRDAVSKIKTNPRIFNLSSTPHHDFVVDVLPYGYNEDTYDMVSFFSSSAGSGFVFDNVTHVYCQSRLLGISQMNGIIRNSHFEGGTAGGGVILAPELVWYLGGFPSNITVENCTFENTMIFPQMWSDLGGSYPSAAIKVGHGLSPSIYNITIINNRFKNCPVPNIGVFGASNSIITGNTFESPNYFGSDPQSSVCYQDLICFDHLNNRNVTAFDNYLIGDSVKQGLSFSQKLSYSSELKKIKVETLSNLKNLSWTLVDTYVLDINANALFYYPKNASEIHVDSFKRAMSMANGRVPRMIIKKGNYVFANYIRWTTAKFVIDFSGSKLLLGPRKIIITGGPISIMNYQSVTELPPLPAPVVNANNQTTTLIKCSKCYPYKPYPCSISDILKAKACCYNKTTECMNTLLL